MRGKQTLILRSVRVRGAFWAWSWELKTCGYKIPPWGSASGFPTPTLSPLLDEFVRHRRDVRGLAESTIRQDLALVCQDFFAFCADSVTPLR